MSMRWYVVRRVLWAVVATYLILSVTWGLLAIPPNPAAEQLHFQAAASGGSVVDIRTRESTLEDVFLDVTRQATEA